MSSADHNLSSIDLDHLPDGSPFKFGIVVSRWNQEITYSLRDACLETLKAKGVAEDNIKVLEVPGTFELPQGIRILLQKESKLNALIGIGCVIKGETSHNDYINHAVSYALMQIGITSGKPCIFGVLTPNDRQQAEDRAGGKYGNKGVEAAATALEMAQLAHENNVLGSGKIGFGN